MSGLMTVPDELTEADLQQCRQLGAIVIACAGIDPRLEYPAGDNRGTEEGEVYDLDITAE